MQRLISPALVTFDSQCFINPGFAATNKRISSRPAYYKDIGMVNFKSFNLSLSIVMLMLFTKLF